jgi:hypothetical protein
MCPRNLVGAVALIGCLSLTSPARGGGWFFLGDPPTAPADVSGLPGGPSSKDVTGGFSVSTASREQVRSFFNAVYTASDGLAMNTTSDVANCTPGTNATLFQDAVARRINWFRAMAGLGAAVTLNTPEGADDQAAAVMMAANSELDHFPPSTWSCFTSSGANAASNSNLALGFDGADAITGYIWDYGANNTEVGHRRWILYPQTKVMATGDVPPQGDFFAANATWVFDANMFGPRPSTSNAFVAWPPPGFVPYSLVYPQWSFALSNADLSAATVTMSSDGVNVAVSLQPYQGGYGENTLVWVPMGLDAMSESAVFPFGGADTVYAVTVTNIISEGETIGFSYATTLFDPAVPGTDYVPTTVSGPSPVSVNTTNIYTCAAPDAPGVTGYQWITSQSVSGNLFDGAEAGLINFTATTTPGYSVVTNGLAESGEYSFYLAQPAASGATPSDQFLQLNRVLLPAANSQVSFESLLGYATTNQIAELQISPDDGETWQNLYAEAGTGAPQSSYTRQNVSLSNYAGTPVLLRFDYHYVAPGDYFFQTSVNPPVGWFIDNVLITNVSQMVNFATNATASTNFAFAPSQPGNFNLQAQPVLFSQFPLSAGPIKQVTAVAGAVPRIVLGEPVIANGRVRLAFTVTAAPTATFRLLQVSQLAAAWSTNLDAVLTTNVAGSSYTFTTALGPARSFFRVLMP